MVLYERNFVSLHHKTDKRTKITFKRRFCYNYKEALKLKTTKPDYCFLTAYIMPIVLTATTQHTHI